MQTVCAKQCAVQIMQGDRAMPAVEGAGLLGNTPKVDCCQETFPEEVGSSLAQRTWYRRG